MKKLFSLLKSWGKPGLVLMYIPFSDVAIAILAVSNYRARTKVWITMLGTMSGMCLIMTLMKLGMVSVGLATTLESLPAAFLIGLAPIPQILGGSAPRLAALAIITAMPFEQMILHAIALQLGNWTRIFAIIFFIDEIKKFSRWAGKKLRKK